MANICQYKDSCCGMDDHTQSNVVYAYIDIYIYSIISFTAFEQEHIFHI